MSSFSVPMVVALTLRGKLNWPAALPFVPMDRMKDPLIPLSSTKRLQIKRYKAIE
jgi:hypothetical protein